jgi:hypothetical protein
MATHQLRGRDQRGQLLPRGEHARLYRGLGDANYLGNLEPASPAVPAATEKNQQDDDNDHKCRGIHAAS